MSTEESGISLQQLIGNMPSVQISEELGPNGQTAYVFNKDTNTGQIARAHLPSTFYRDFSMVFHLKPTSKDAGVIFSITDSNKQIMYVGVKLSAVVNNTRKVLFYYTEPDLDKSQEVASFEVQHHPDQWSRFSLAVNLDQLSFYEDCNSRPKVVKFERSPDDMEIKEDTGIFVGQGGAADLDKFQVNISYLAYLTASCKVECF